MDLKVKYDDYFKKNKDIIEIYKTRLDELNNLRNEMFKKGMTYDSEEIQKSLIETRQIYMKQEKMFYTLLHDVTNYFNSKKNEENEILQEFKFLRNEIQLNYYQCFAERTKIENQTNFHNTAKLSSLAKNQHLKMENLIKEQKEYDKKILEIMGIFLSIFSIIGLGTSSILNIENNHFAIWSMICGVILITMSGLFYMINYKDESTMNKRIMLPVIIGILLFCIGTVAIIKYPTENKPVKDLETRLKIVEEKIDYEKRINELENKTK